METRRKQINISPEDKKAFMAGLKSGLGLTRSSTLILIKPKDISELLLSNQTMYKECQEAVKYAAKILLVLSNQHLQDKDFGKWKENNEYIKTFIADIHTWECYTPKKVITPLKAAEAYIMTSDIDEAATACGMTPMEFKQYIIRNPKYQQYINALRNSQF